jgi:hypothetical protein
MKTATRTDRFYPRSQPKMISIAENNTRIEILVFEFLETDSLHTAGRSDGHENRCFDFAAPRE